MNICKLWINPGHTGENGGIYCICFREKRPGTPLSVFHTGGKTRLWMMWKTAFFPSSARKPPHFFPFSFFQPDLPAPFPLIFSGKYEKIWEHEAAANRIKGSVPFFCLIVFAFACFFPFAPVGFGQSKTILSATNNHTSTARETQDASPWDTSRCSLSR